MAQAGYAIVYVSPYRGTREFGRYRATKTSHQTVADMDDAEKLKAYIKLVNWQSFQRTASFAGPLAMKYIVQIARPLFLYSETQRQALGTQGHLKTPAPAKAATGGKKGAGAAKASSSIGGTMSRMVSRVMSQKTSKQLENGDEDMGGIDEYISPNRPILTSMGGSAGLGGRDLRNLTQC